MRILVTGGAGFIGSHFIRHILKAHPDYKIINLDKLTYAGNLNNLKDISKGSRYRFIKGDICNKDLVDRITKTSDTIVNFAASTHVDRSILKPDEFIKTNVFGVDVLLEAAKKNKIKRFLQISTDEVYGSKRYGSFNEGSPLNPSNPYSASKAAADHLAMAYFYTYGLDIVITRSCNNFGPCQFPDKIIPLFITHALRDKPLPLYADGSNIRDWIFVLDNCRAIDIVLHKGKKGKIYNISAKNEISNLSLSHLILNKLGKPLSLIRHVKDRPGHDFRYALDPGKIKPLGFRPQYSFQEALEITIDWYKKNPDHWKKR